MRSVGVLFGLAHHTPSGGCPAWQELNGLDLGVRLALIRADRLAELIAQADGGEGGIDPALLFPLDTGDA